MHEDIIYGTVIPKINGESRTTFGKINVLSGERERNSRISTLYFIKINDSNTKDQNMKY